MNVREIHTALTANARRGAITEGSLVRLVDDAGIVYEVSAGDLAVVLVEPSAYGGEKFLWIRWQTGAMAGSSAALYARRFELVEEAQVNESGNKMTEADAINFPSHYTAGRSIEPIDAIESWGLGYRLGNVVKYVSRAGRKGDAVQDLKKARRYIDREIAALEGRTGVWE